MRLFPRIGCRSTIAAIAALVVAVGALAVSGPHASAGELRDKQRAVHRRVERAARDLDGSSARLRRVTHALSHARAQLSAARVELRDVRARLAIARERDEEMREALAQAQARLDQARADVAQGQQALQDQRDEVVDSITQIYEQGDPQLLAFASIMNAQTVADITWQREANASLIERQDNQYEELRAAEVLLKVHEEEVRTAAAEVAAKRQEAADQLAEMQDLTQESLEAKDRVIRLVLDRKDAEAAASEVKHRDSKALRKLRKHEAKIQRLIKEAIRKARQRARRKAARAARRGAAASGMASSTPSDPGGLLLRPVDGPITSPFGYRIHPIYHYWGLHDGDDFGAPCGAPLRAVATGTVLSEYYSSVWGNRLYLNLGMVNGNFITVIYNHLSQYAVPAGANVGRGQTVGYVGTTGWSTGCHLHFTVMENGHAVDPMKYF